MYRKLEEQGVMVIEPEKEALDKWKEQTAQIYEEYDSRFPGLIERIRGIE